MGTGDRNDPYLGFNFLVEIEGRVAGGFTEVSGLQIEIETEERREGGRNEFVHKLAGRVKYPANLVLKHGITDNDDLWRWCQDVQQGKVQRHNISIVLLDSAGDEKRRWVFEAACPVKWVGPDLRAGQAEVAVESVELVHRGLTAK